VWSENGDLTTFFATARVICQYIHRREGTSGGSGGGAFDSSGIILLKT
jgi:hypothetical protein